MRSRSILAGIAVLLMTGPAPAQRGGDVYVVMGLGSATCAYFADLNRRDPRNEVAFSDWAQGFMSGINWKLNADPSTRRFQRNLAATSIQSQRVYIRRYCDQRPSDVYVAAVYDLFNSLPEIPPDRL